MFVLGNFFQALAVVMGYVLEAMTWLVIIRALLSWVSPDPYNPIVQFIERVTEPLLAPIRTFIPAHRIGIDISPIIAVLFLYFLKIFLVQTLFGLAVRFRG
jgi:YggT family protein